MHEWEAERSRGFNFQPTKLLCLKKKITKFTAVKCAHASPQVETHKQVETQVSRIS